MAVSLLTFLDLGANFNRGLMGETDRVSWFVFKLVAVARLAVARVIRGVGGGIMVVVFCFVWIRELDRVLDLTALDVIVVLSRYS